MIIPPRMKGLAILARGCAIGVVLTVCAGGCERAWRNGFLDPTQTGRFDSQPVRNEIRRTLGPLEEPEGIPGAVEPTQEDLVATFEEQPIGRSDVLDISVFELMQPGTSTDIRRVVNEVGYVTLPVIGPMKVAGLTPRQFELELTDRVRGQGVLQNPEISVNVVQSQARKVSVIGNVNRPGDYPLTRADYRLLELIGAVGPISQTQKKIYILRGGQPGSRTPPGAEAPFMPRPGSTSQPARREEDPFAPSSEPAAPASLGDFGTGRVAPSEPSSSFLQDGPEIGGGTRGSSRPASRSSSGGSRRMSAAPSSEPSHRDFLGLLNQNNGAAPPELEGLTTRRAPSSKFIFLNGEWVEVPESGPSSGRTGRGETEAASRPEGVDWEAMTAAEAPLRVIEIPFEQLQNGEMRYNVVLRSNDIVSIPSGAVGEYYVTGHVSRPGAYTLTGRDITVKEAIAAAGGFGLLAWPSRCELIRRLAGDQEEIRSVNLDKIFSGDEPDFYLRASDIINVGTTAVAPFLATIRNSFRLSYGFGFVYDRNFADGDGFFAKEALRQRRRTERLQRGFPP